MSLQRSMARRSYLGDMWWRVIELRNHVGFTRCVWTGTSLEQSTQFMFYSMGTYVNNKLPWYNGEPVVSQCHRLRSRCSKVHQTGRSRAWHVRAGDEALKIINFRFGIEVNQSVETPEIMASSRIVWLPTDMVIVLKEVPIISVKSYATALKFVRDLGISSPSC